MIKKLACLFMVVCLITPSLCCGDNSNSITIAGSTTILPLAEKLAKGYEALNTEVNISVMGGSSSVGVQQAASGTVDIGTCSRELVASEKGAVVENILAKDGVAIILHPSNPVNDLSLEQIRNIYTGSITNWEEVGGPDESIHVIAREEGSGTREAFQLLVMDYQLITASAILQTSNGSMRVSVAGDRNSIGFLSFGYIDDSVKAISISGVAPIVDNAKNGSYPIVRPLLFLTKSQPRGIVKDFIDFCLSEEGQSIVDAEGYLTVR
jgi:phosphate transport system substrate-binding protein